MTLKQCLGVITVCREEGGTYRVQVLLCPAPEEGTSIFSKEATALALAIDPGLLPAFAKGEGSLVWFVEMLVSTVLVLYLVYGKSSSPGCVSSKLYCWWPHWEKREYKGWRVVLPTCVSAASSRPQQELGQRCSCQSLILQATCDEFLDLQDRILCIFLFIPWESRYILQASTISFLRCCNAFLPLKCINMSNECLFLTVECAREHPRCTSTELSFGFCLSLLSWHLGLKDVAELNHLVVGTYSGF